MALEYFLYTTAYTNTLVGRSNTSFAPSPPYDEILIDYFIPNYQPLYYYRESGGTIVINSEANINAYLQGTAPPPQPEDPVFQETFTGYTASTGTQISALSATTDNKIDKVTGATGSVGVFLSNGNLQDSGYSISQLTGSTTTWGGITGTLSAQTDLQNALNAKENTITGAATTITTANLTINRALLSNASGKVAVSTITSTELGYLSGTASNIQPQLNLKAPLLSPALTGTPIAPTAAIGTNTTQLATTAYYIGSAANTNPLMDNTVSIGTSTRFARQDHVHPKDTAKANLAGGAAFTGTITVPKPAQNDNTTCVATTSWYISQAGTATPLINGTAAVGTSNLFTRQDHVHPRDTTKLSLSGGTMTGTLCMTNAYMTTVSTGGTLTDYQMVWNPTTKEVRTISPQGDSSVYCYTDKRTTQNNTTTTNATYLTATWSLPDGYYEYEYNALYGNNSSNRCAVVCFVFDGAVVGYCNLMKTNDTNTVVSAYVTQNNNVNSGNHTASIVFHQLGGGTASIYTGAIRIQKIGVQI